MYVIFHLGFVLWVVQARPVVFTISVTLDHAKSLYNPDQRDEWGLVEEFVTVATDTKRWTREGDEI